MRVRAPGVVTVVVILGVLGVHLLPFEVVRVPTASMAPTLRPGDHVLLDRRSVPVERGQLVVLPDVEDLDSLMVKRVVAIGGDTVEFDDGFLVVNGIRPAEPYAEGGRVPGVYFAPVTVPAGAVYLLGDDRGDSVDSRTFGPLPADRVVGRVTFRVFPRPGAP
nr:signal peptidase I [Pseudonocardia sp. C8]